MLSIGTGKIKKTAGEEKKIHLIDVWGENHPEAENVPSISSPVTKPKRRSLPQVRIKAIHTSPQSTTACIVAIDHDPGQASGEYPFWKD